MGLRKEQGKRQVFRAFFAFPEKFTLIEQIRSAKLENRLVSVPT
jgi:hypothetical protein